MFLETLLGIPYMSNLILDLLPSEDILATTVTCKALFAILSPIVSYIFYFLFFYCYIILFLCIFIF